MLALPRCNEYRLLILERSLDGGGHVMSRHDRAKSRGLWLSLARQVVEIRSMHGRLCVSQSPGRAAVTRPANVAVVTEHTLQHIVLNSFIGDYLHVFREASASFIQ